jgi:glycerophosphoryl diester phosphodiesterase
MCELKVDHDSGETDTPLVEAVAAVIEHHHAETWSAIHSFDPEIVATARRIAPAVSGAIIAVRQDAPGFERCLSSVVKRGAQALSLEYNCITREYVLRAKRRQVTLWAWTADAPADWRRLVAVGVDGIITNVPHRLRAYLEGVG